MDILINHRKDKEGNKEFVKVLFLEKGNDIYLEVFKKDNFTSQEFAELVKSKIENGDIENVRICSDEPINTFLINQLTNRNIEKEPYQKIRPLKRNETSYQLTDDDFLVEKEMKKIEKRKELSLFLFKKYKKTLLVEQEFHLDKLINTNVNYLSSTVINSDNVIEYIKKTKLDENPQDYKILLRTSSSNGKKSKGTIQLKFFGEMIERYLSQKVETIGLESQLNYKNSTMRKSRFYLDKERDEYLQKLQHPENVVIFSDGSAKDQRQSSSFIIRYNGKEESRTYLFEENLKNYEEVALLKSLEYVFDKKLHNKKVFIISDYDHNVHILNGLKDGIINQTNNAFKNLYYKVFNAFKDNPLNCEFSAIKSHTDENEEFDFVYNKKVDKLAGQAILFQHFIPKECFMTADHLLSNNLTPLDLDTPGVRYKKDYIQRTENSEFGFLERNRAKKIANRNPIDSSTIVIVAKQVKGKKHIRFAFKHLSEGVSYFDLAVEKGISPKKVFSQFIDESIKNKNFSKSGLRIFYQGKEFKNMVRDEIEKRINENDSLFLSLKERHMISAVNFKDDPNHKKQIGQMSITAAHNAYINKNILKIKPTQKKPKKVIERHRTHDFKVDFSTDIFGEEKVFPAFNEFHSSDIYFFFNDHNQDKIKLTSIHNNEKKEQFLSKDKLFYEFNEILRNTDTKGTRNCMISTVDNKMKDEFLMTFKREVNLECNVVKILDKKYARDRLLILPHNEYEKHKEKLSWYKDIHPEKKKRQLKIK